MTATSYAFADPRAQSSWSKDVFAYALQNVFFTKMMGKDRNAAVFVNTDLTVKKGGTVVCEAKYPLTNAGVGDDGDTTGSEGQIRRRNMSVTVHERANACVSAGNVSEQLTASEFRQDAKDDLGDWLAEAMENDIVTSAAGLYNENSGGASIETVNEAYPTYSATRTLNRIFFGGQSADGTSISTNYTTDALLTAATEANTLMGTKILEKVKRIAVAAVPRIRPVALYDLSRLNDDDVRSGKNLGELIARVYVVLLHPLQIKSIKAETGTSGWASMVAAAGVRGNLNPLFQGASFFWDGMLCFEYDRIPMRTGAGATALTEGFALDAGRTATTDACATGRSVARALLLGGQGITFAWAKKPSWAEDYVDCDKGKVKVSCLYGVKRTQFNAHGGSSAGSEEGIICIDTHVQLDS